MEVLTVIEHESVPILQFRERGQKVLNEAHASALVKLEKKLPTTAWIWGNREIKFQHYCGVITLGNLSVEILPKIYGIETDAGSSRHALVRMLYKARRIKLIKAGSATIALQKHNLMDVFILHFCDQLRGLLMQGMIHKYVECEENLKVLRGRLRIEQQFKQNLAHRERLYCQYDELSEDNAHNQVLKYVLKILLKTAIANHVHSQVAELLMRFDPISNCTADVAMLDSLNFDRSTARFKPIFEQCRWLLKGVYPDVLAGKETCISLLFNMNQLFEAYVGCEFRKKAWSQGLRMREQGPPKFFARRQDTDDDIFMMKPDFSFLNKKNQVVAIADAKWKVLDESERKLGISQADLYQMESYALSYQVKDLTLVYPMQQNLTMPIQLTLKGSGVTVSIQPFDVASVF